MKKGLSLILAVIMIMAGMQITVAEVDTQEPTVASWTNPTPLPYVPDEIVVKFKNDSKPFRVIKVPKGKVQEKVREYGQMKNVEYAEPNFIATAHAAPNDSLYFRQWNLRGLNEGGIDWEAAWNTASGNVVVAILDTGIAYEDYQDKYYLAPDLDPNSFVPGYDFINNDSHPNDDNSHGTHVAGTVAQKTNNNEGVAGVAYEKALLMPVKVLDKSGSGSYTAIANGIRFAADNGAQVINMSLGGPSGSAVLYDAIRYAYLKRVTIISSAGNSSSSSLGYPAAYEEVISVGATRFDKNLAPYSNYGPDLDIVAPGGDTSVDQNDDGRVDGILQSTFNPRNKRPSDFAYYYFQGTSMASPHVAGTAALILDNGNAITPQDVRYILEKSAIDLGAAGRDNTFGHGLINIVNALAEPALSNAAPTAQDVTATVDPNSSVDIELLGSDPDEGDGFRMPDTLTYKVLTAPSNGTLNVAVGEMLIDPVVSYTPDPDYNGPDSFTFEVSDGKVESPAAEVKINEPIGNVAPTAYSDSATVDYETLTPIEMRADDPNPGDVLTYKVLSLPGHGSLTVGGVPVAVDDVLASPWVDYDPNAGYDGPDSFTFQAHDGEFPSNTATISITVNPPNQAPTAYSDPAFVPYETLTPITMRADDPEGDELTYKVLSAPANGSLNVAVGAVLTSPVVEYTPDAGYSGPDSFTFQANDGEFPSNTATISITVGEEPQALSVSVEMPYGGLYIKRAGPNRFVVANAAVTVADGSGGVDGAAVSGQWLYQDAVVRTALGNTDPSGFALLEMEQLKLPTGTHTLVFEVTKVEVNGQSVPFIGESVVEYTFTLN